MPENTLSQDKIREAGKEHSRLVTDARKAKNLCWIQHPLIDRHINKLISSDPSINWLQWFKERYATPAFEYGMSLGCGTGLVEREAVSKGICKRFDGFDITPDSIEKAKSEAKANHMESSLHYEVRDLNEIRLEPDKYDFILISHAYHHVAKLEHTAREMRKALKPDGIILMSEYIGPSQFQFTDPQLEWMNLLLGELPEKYRKDLRTGEGLKGPVIRPTREFMSQADPSEAIRSDEIIPVTRRYFDLFERKDYGGTLLQFLLADIAGNFDPQDLHDKELMEYLCDKEWHLIREGTLSSDFAILVWKHKPFTRRVKKLFGKVLSK
jgi:2-polyprenyl-3-methyl-5-hydroxy-6-metoxy-1,4-benzoquinol methylase